MRRRSVLLGLGTAAAGSGIAFGSGAFTQVQASRDVTIGIDEDSNALLALEAESNIASVSNDADTGELYIDTNQITEGDGNEGFNSGAQIQIGETSESFGDTVEQGKGAFTITNNFETVDRGGDTDDQIDIGIDLSDLTDPKSDLEFVITVYGEGGNRNFRVSPSDGREVITDVAPNEVLHVAIFLDTASVSDPEDFDGEVVISAGPSLGEDAGFPTDDELVGENQILNVNTGATFDAGELDTPIQDAVTDANSFETLRVGAGTFDESVTVDVESLTLEGAGSGSTTIDATGEERGFNIKTDGVTLRGLTVESAGEDVSNGEVEGIFIGNPSGFTDTGETIEIKDVEIKDIDGTGTGNTTEGIHIKHYDVGDPISDVYIDNITISGVDSPTSDPKGANGIKLQAEINDISITSTDINEIGGGWGYGVALTGSSNESGTPTDVSFSSVTIDGVTASGSNLDSIGIGIDSSSGDPVSPENGSVPDPSELSFEDTEIKNVDIGLVNKNTSKDLTTPSEITFSNVGDEVANPEESD